MKIEDAIKQLQEEKKNGTKNLIVAWWKADMFERQDDNQWAADAEYIEDKMDWSNAWDAMNQMLDEQ